MASQNMTLRLLVDKTTQKVLYAETTKEFVDFLVHLSSLPLGTVLQILGSKQMVGCLGKLKESMENFNQIYFQPGIDKDNIFNFNPSFIGNTLLLSDDVSGNDKPATPTTIYSCDLFGTGNSYNSYYQYCRSVTEDPVTLCPTCKRRMNVVLQVVGSPAVKEAKVKLSGGYVKEVVTYMVMDDLAVKPMSTISSITLINSFGVKDLSQLEEKILHIGKDEALKLLKASLSTSEVLTTLFRQTNVA